MKNIVVGVFMDFLTIQHTHKRKPDRKYKKRTRAKPSENQNVIRI